MTTLHELKTKYQEAEAARQREYAAKEQAKEDHRQEVLAETLPKVCEYLSEREGVDISDLMRHGRIEGDWYSPDDLNYVTFYLELAYHWQVSIRLRIQDLTNNTRVEWQVDNNYNSYQQLGNALLKAAELYERYQTEQAQEIEDKIEKRQWDETKATEAKQRNAAKQRIFDQIANDPTALLLIKLFAQIQQDRNALADQISSLEAYNADAEYWHSEALSRVRSKAEQAAREASEANSRTQSLQYEVYDLEDKVKKAAKRQSSW